MSCYVSVNHQCFSACIYTCRIMCRYTDTSEFSLSVWKCNFRRENCYNCHVPSEFDKYHDELTRKWGQGWIQTSASSTEWQNADSCGNSTVPDQPCIDGTGSCLCRNNIGSVSIFACKAHQEQQTNNEPVRTNKPPQTDNRPAPTNKQQETNNNRPKTADSKKCNRRATTKEQQQEQQQQRRRRRRTDGPTNGPTDRRTDRQTDRQTDRKK